MPTMYYAMEDAAYGSDFRSDLLEHPTEDCFVCDVDDVEETEEVNVSFNPLSGYIGTRDCKYRHITVWATGAITTIEGCRIQTTFKKPVYIGEEFYDADTEDYIDSSHPIRFDDLQAITRQHMGLINYGNGWLCE